MTTPSVRVHILADFNAANFAAYLTQGVSPPAVTATVGPMGDIGTSGRSPDGAVARADVVVVWTRPEAVSSSFVRLLEHGVVEADPAIADVDRFADEVDDLRQRCARVIVMSWVAPPMHAAFGSIAMKPGYGIAHLLMRMNLHLAERIAAMTGVVLLDAGAFLDAERTPEDAKLWYAAKIPYRNQVFQRAARQVKSTLRATTNGPRKLIVLDLDDTVWGGIVGEVGTSGLRLGGHDPVGEAYVAFQRALLALSRRGFLLAIVSKNEEQVALEAIREHPEMVLRQDAFSGWRINWDDKAANIAAVTEALNLGLNAVVFIDDQAAERGRVREALPDVFVPDWPSSPLQFVDALFALGCFDMVALTDEDRVRSELYAAERVRTLDRAGADSGGDWLRRLELRVDVEEIHERNLPRVVQLLNKTNQMNLSTRRLDAVGLSTWLAAGRRKLWSFRVSDRFGDAGLTGIASIDVDGGRAVLVDFVLSCRVFGRRVEHAMLHVASEAAHAMGGGALVATLVPTAKNVPCRRFLEASGMKPEGENRFVWDLAAPFPCPPDVHLRREVEVG